jgi:hypothetical protein
MPQKKLWQQRFYRLTLSSCILTSVMGNNSPIGKAYVGEVSVANRADINRQREFDRAQVKKTVMKREPRCRLGTSPNSRLNRRRPARSTISHLQVREITMSENIYVGIDVAKDSFYAASCPSIIKAHLPNTPDGHRKLLQLLQKEIIALIVLEATGGYERPLVAELISNSLPVVVVNPRQVRDFAKGMGAEGKDRSYRCTGSGPIRTDRQACP